MNGAKRAARDTHKPDHLAFDFIESHKVQGVLQYAAEAPMIFGRSQNDPSGPAYLSPQLKDILRQGAFVLLPIAKDKMVILQIDQSCLGAELLGASQGNLYRHAGITAASYASANANDNNAVSSLVLLIHGEFPP